MTWFTIRMVIVISIINGWSTYQVDFVLVLTQANIEFDMYIKITQGIETKGGIRKTHILNILKNLYGNRQVYRVCKHHIAK